MADGYEQLASLRKMLTVRRQEALEKMGAGFSRPEDHHQFHVMSGRTRELGWVIEKIGEQIKSINTQEGSTDGEGED